jgi:Peptidase C10 family/Spi protease inhibitor
MKKSNSFILKMLIIISVPILLTQCNDHPQLAPESVSTTTVTDSLSVTLNQAEKIANLEISGKSNAGIASNSRVAADTSNKNRIITDSKTFKDKKDNSAAFHVINYHKIDAKTNKKQMAGFVIISADRRLVPVLASSETNRFNIDSIPEGVNIWVEMVFNELSKAKEKLKSPNQSVTYLWKEYEAKQKNGRVATPYPVCPSGIYTNTGVLLKTEWAQGTTYNLTCPPIGCGPCGRAYTGCGPTAIAQVWNYYQKPNFYYSAGGGQTYYDYPLPASRTGFYCDFSTTPLKDRHMAVLLKEAGIGAQTNYNYLGSCSSLTWRDNVRQAFIYAGYSNPGQRGNLISNLTAINSELLNGKPVILDGNTSFNLSNWHIGVMDGYES